MSIDFLKSYPPAGALQLLHLKSGDFWKIPAGQNLFWGQLVMHILGFWLPQFYFLLAMCACVSTVC